MYQRMDFYVENNQGSEGVALCIPEKYYREGIKKKGKTWYMIRKSKWQNMTHGEQGVE